MARTTLTAAVGVPVADNQNLSWQGSVAVSFVDVHLIENRR
ncbi:MAG: hypothetical protein ABFC71_11275 [Methanoregula sp.]|jgi:hypothetical protein